MKVEDAWKEVVNILKADSTLSSYVKGIYEGVREDLPLFPSILLVPSTETEVIERLPKFVRIEFSITLFAYVEVYTIEKQIIGEANEKGILDLVSDIKTALWKYPNLNGKCIKFFFPTTSYDYTGYPYWEGRVMMQITLEMEATQR